MKRIKYYLIAAVATSFMMDDVRTNIALSENPAEFLLRNIGKKGSDDNCLLLNSIKISEKQYNALLIYNPTNEGYFKLKEADYSEVVTEEEDDEDE